MPNDLLIQEFHPMYLLLDHIGPFRDEVYEIDFTDKDHQPCNFFLLTSKNGSGKTTVLDTMSCLLGLLGQSEPKQYGLEDLDKGDGRAQLDIKLRVYWQGQDHNIVLSILAGHSNTDLSLKVWDAEQLQAHIE